VEMEELDSGNQGFRNLSHLRVLLGMSGISLSLVFFVVVMTLKGNFSLLWLIVALVCVAGTIITAMGWRERKSWLTVLGTVSLLSLVVGGIAASQ
jgi:uncharacterized membrane protein HdeD (DUF308 family)